VLLVLVAFVSLYFIYRRFKNKNKNKPKSANRDVNSIDGQTFKLLASTDENEAKKVARVIFDNAAELAKGIDNENVKKEYLRWLSDQKQSSIMTNSYPSLSLWMHGVVDSPYQSILRTFYSYATTEGKAKPYHFSNAVKLANDKELELKVYEIDSFFGAEDIVIKSEEIPISLFN
jgi:hypothetical protein